MKRPTFLPERRVPSGAGVGSGPGFAGRLTSEQMSADPWQGWAIHEAGHAVAAHKLGARVVEIHLCSKGDHEHQVGGTMRYRGLWGSLPVVLAGPAAEARLNGLSLCPDESDGGRLTRMLGAFPEAFPPGLVARSRLFAQAMIDDECIWRSIRRVADALLEQRDAGGPPWILTLSGCDLGRALGSRSWPSTFHPTAALHPPRV